MKSKTMTGKDLDEQGFFREDGLEFDGILLFEKGLGVVKFRKSVKVAGYIEAIGCSIEAGEGIEAGWSIKVGRNIKAGGSIKAGLGIEAGCGI